MTPKLKRAMVPLTVLMLAGAGMAQQTPADPINLAGLAQDAVSVETVQGAADLQRSSTIQLPFDAPNQSQSLLIAHTPAQGSSYVPGSSRLGELVLPDPKRGPSGTLYWTLDARTLSTITPGAALRGVLSYQLSHTDTLGALPRPTMQGFYTGDRTETLTGHLDEKDWRAAGEFQAASDEAQENPGAIKLPLANAIIQVRERINITVEAPIGAIPVLNLNGEAVSPELIGTNTQDGSRGVQRLTFVGVRLKTGENVIRFLDQEIKVILVGATRTIEVKPLQTQADGSTPIRIGLRTLDEFGRQNEQPTVTIRSNLEPHAPDAAGGEPGHQVKMVNGQGILELRPQSAPTRLDLLVQNGTTLEQYTIDITPAMTSVGVGVVSATVGLNGGLQLLDDLTWQGRAYYEGPVGKGKLYLAADKDGLPTDQDTLRRSPVYGDASTEQVPLQGIDPVALSYDHPDFRAEYRRSNLLVDVLPVGEQLTALTAYSKTNPGVSGFVALVPGDQVTDTPLIPQGNRLLRLPDSNIVLGSETLVLVTLERATGQELRRTTWIRNVDYVLDASTGVITLARALDRLDAQLNEQVVYASYRRDDPMSKRALAYGAQVKYSGEHYTVGAAVVSLDDQLTFGVRATYADDTTVADATASYAGGVQFTAAAQTRVGERHTFSVKGSYRDASYRGLAPVNPGTHLVAAYTGQITDRLSAIVDAEYRNVPLPRQADVENQDRIQGGSVSARAEYKLEPFSVGLGAKYAFGDQYGFGLVGSVGYQRDPLSISVVHTHPVTGNLNATTDLGVKYKIGEHLHLGFADKITWGIGQAAALTLDSMIGNVNYAVAYELPTASGDGNRARFSVGTTLPLNERLALGLRGSALYSVSQGELEAGAGADLKYHTDHLVATTGVDLNYASQRFGVVLRGGVTGSVTDQLTLTADALLEYAPETADVEGKAGQRFSLGYAYRASRLNSLGYVRYVNGSLAGNTPELSAGAAVEYRVPKLALRGGVDTRTLLADRDSFTYQVYGGGLVYVTDFLGVGGWGRMVSQPATGHTQFGYGLEGSVRALPGTWLSAGYNFKGFDGLPSAGTYTKRGAYLRLDLTLDETLGGKK